MKTSKEKLYALRYEETGVEDFSGLLLTCYKKKKLRYNEKKRRKNDPYSKEEILLYDINLYVLVYPDFSFITMFDKACLSPLEILALAEEIKKLRIKENEKD